MDVAATLSAESYKTSHIVSARAINNSEMESVPDAGLESQSRVVCRIAFEEYLGAWVKIATTKPGLIMRKESLDALIQCPEMLAAHYGISGSGSDDLTVQQRKVFKEIMYGPGLKKCSKSKLARVNQIRRTYLLYRSPDLRTPHISEPRDLIRDMENQDCWEGEVDKLLAWTHSLSFEDLDRQ